MGTDSIKQLYMLIEMLLRARRGKKSGKKMQKGSDNPVGQVEIQNTGAYLLLSLFLWRGARWCGAVPNASSRRFSVSGPASDIRAEIADRREIRKSSTSKVLAEDEGGRPITLRSTRSFGKPSHSSKKRYLRLRPSSFSFEDDVVWLLCYELPSERCTSPLLPSTLD